MIELADALPTPPVRSRRERCILLSLQARAELPKDATFDDLVARIVELGGTMLLTSREVRALLHERLHIGLGVAAPTRPAPAPVMRARLATGELHGDAWMGFLDVERGIAAPLRCRVEMPARRGRVLVDPENNEYEERDLPAEMFPARLLAHESDGTYLVTNERHRPWLTRVPPAWLVLRLQDREVFTHVRAQVATRLGLAEGAGLRWSRRPGGRWEAAVWILEGSESAVQFLSRLDTHTPADIPSIRVPGISETVTETGALVKLVRFLSEHKEIRLP